MTKQALKKYVKNITDQPSGGQEWKQDVLFVKAIGFLEQEAMNKTNMSVTASLKDEGEIFAQFIACHRRYKVCCL